MADWPVQCGCCQRGAPDGFLIRCDRDAELRERDAEGCEAWVALDRKE